ncbi:MAG: RNA polymerase sigma-70 factor [Dysgonamonadaceae bacterium]|jgi:RNA polymerase sigma-70 factor (ECF subfamily)|nr:RNA polymerase sigma-70 factor [Dysgonamonadaceae bacterium]
MKISFSTNVEDQYFSEVYLSYYSRLVSFAREYVVSEEDAENIVQDLFLFLWENKEMLHTLNNPNAYFFTLTKNRCIDFLRKKNNEINRNEKIQSTFEAELKLKLDSLEVFDTFDLNDKNIEDIITEAINSLPEKCREIFLLSRFDGLKYKEIAEKLNLSVNTVENQMSIALRKLRMRLKNYLFALVVFPLLNVIQ